MIHVVCATDAGYAMQTAVLARSLSTTAQSDELHLHVITRSVDDESCRRIRQASSISTTLIEDDGSYGDVHLPDYLTESTLTRLRLPDLLPDVERVVYLDADTIVRDDLRKLANVALGEASIAAVRDGGVPWHGTLDLFPWREAGHPPSTPYFNAGVMVIELGRWREQAMGPRVLEFLRTVPTRFGDQCGLNAVIGPDWSQLAPRWNLQSGHLRAEATLAWVVEEGASLQRAIDDPAIVHFNAPSEYRPWTHGSIHPYRDEWLALLDQTPWAGWRAAPPPSRAVQTAHRLGRLVRRTVASVRR